MKIDTKGQKIAVKPAFSLAEAMIMLVIISILMALAAPLIVRRTTADSRRLIRINGTDIFTAIGQNQKLGVGTSSPNAKLHVTDAPAGTPFFEVRGADATGLRVAADGRVNIVACTPDWENFVIISDGDDTPEDEDGYLSSPFCLWIDNGYREELFCPGVVVNALTGCVVTEGNIDMSECTYDRNFFNDANIEVPRVMVPVKFDSYVSYAYTDIFSNFNIDGTSGGENDLNTYFIPCDKGYKAYNK